VESGAALEHGEELSSNPIFFVEEAGPLRHPARAHYGDEDAAAPQRVLDVGPDAPGGFDMSIEEESKVLDEGITETPCPVQVHPASSIADEDVRHRVGPRTLALPVRAVESHAASMATSSRSSPRGMPSTP
jgi:hypothetical protein